MPVAINEINTKDLWAIYYISDSKSSLSAKDCTARLQNAFGRETPHAVFLSMIKFVKVDPEREENMITYKRLIKENQHISYEKIRKDLGIGINRISKILFQH